MTEQEFVFFYEKYHDMVYRICILHLKNKDDALDILQNVFLKLYTKAITFETSEHRKRWLLRVCINACKDYNKTFWRKQVFQLPLDIASTNDFLHPIYEIRRLPYKYRDVLHLYYYEGYSVTEIAEILHISSSCVKSRLKRARDKLKLELEEQNES